MSPNRGRVNSVLNWKLPLRILKDRTERIFCSERDFIQSSWGEWKRRIDAEHKKEIERISALAATMDDDDSFSNDWLADDTWEEWCLCNTMHAVVVVTLWSEMENFLKRLVQVVLYALEKERRALQGVKEFCEASLGGTVNHEELRNSIKELKDIQTGVLYVFPDMKKTIQRDLEIQIEQCSQYSTINAIRILCNSFKHNRGFYHPKADKPETQIDQALREEWNFLKEQNEIDYAKLPIQEMVVACHLFCLDICQRTEDIIPVRRERLGL